MAPEETPSADGTFTHRLEQAIARTGAPVCVGLDPHPGRLPPGLVRDLTELDAPGRRVALAEASLRFGLQVVHALSGLIHVLKPQVAFFEALGAPGLAALEVILGQAREAGMVVILDAKRGDIGSTAEAYARGALDDDGPLAADAVTASPYLGPESLEPFLARAPRKGCFVLVRTSNPGAEVWQGGAPGIADWIDARNAAEGPGLGSLGAVVAATGRQESEALRARMPHTWFLVPGWGAQGAGIDEVAPLFLEGGRGAIVSASRSVLFPAPGEVEVDITWPVRRRATAFLEEVSRGLGR